MLMRSDDDLGRFIEPVARALLGDPNPHHSKPGNLRFGSHGSLHIDTAKGTAYDHENKQGGGVLWLIEREKKLHGAAAFDFMKQIGCDIDLSKPAVPPKIVATYDYLDEDGSLLFQVVRFEPKKFLQRKRDGDDWSWKVAGTRQVPYRLPDLLEAIANERTVFIVEGEKDVERLRRFGVPATCNAGGAGKWRDEFAQYFHGADGIIICDNDAAGRAHGDQVGESLAKVAARVRLLDLPNLPPKGDASDWIEAGGTIEQFYELALAAPTWAPRAPAFESRFGGLRWEQIGAAAQQVGYSWLIEDIIPLGEITLAFGDSGTGKSFNIFDMSMCVARGIPFNARNVEPGLVVYVAAEAGKGFAKRKLAYQQFHNIGVEPIPFYLLTKRPDFFSSDDHVDLVIKEIEAIEAAYGRKVVLIVFDTLSALAPGMNENASADVSRVRARFVKVNERFDGAIIVVHHKPKGGSTPRGHGSLTADFETTIEFETDPSRVSPEGFPVHRATVRKQREGKKGENWEFILPVVEVGKNKWGNPETSCVVTNVTSSAKAVTGFKLSPTEAVFMESLFEALLQSPTLPPPGLPEQITKAVDASLVRNIMKSRLISGEEDEASADQRFRTAYSRAGSQLVKYGVIGHRKPLMWFTGKPLRGVKVPEMET